jgi:hypothetical protein
MIIPRLGYDIRRASAPADPGKIERSLPAPTVAAEDRGPGGDHGNDTALDAAGEDPRPVARSQPSPNGDLTDP